MERFCRTAGISQLQLIEPAPRPRAHTASGAAALPRCVATSMFELPVATWRRRRSGSSARTGHRTGCAVTPEPTLGVGWAGCRRPTPRSCSGGFRRHSRDAARRRVAGRISAPSVSRPSVPARRSGTPASGATPAMSRAAHSPLLVRRGSNSPPPLQPWCLHWHREV